VAGTARNRLMPTREQETGNSESFEEVLTLKPGVEFRLPARAAVVPDGQDTWFPRDHFLFGRHHHDLDFVVSRGEPGLDRGTRGCVARRDPGIPYGVHFAETGHVGDPDIGRQQLCLVTPGLGQEAVNLFQNVLGLLGDTLAFRVIGHNASEIDGIAMHDRFAHARSDIVTLDGHVSPLGKSIGAVPSDLWPVWEPAWRARLNA